MKILGIIIMSFILFTSCKDNKNSKEPIKQDISSKRNIPLKVDTSKMVYFEEGTILIGSNEGGANEKPTFEKKINEFYLDKNLVTVKEFRVFVLKTGFKTDADKFGDSGVFSFDNNAWELIKGANWEFPLGTDQPKASDNHPVTHVSWNDAKAYSSWIGKRLPTEFEWEFAAKNGEDNSNKYAWGNVLVVNNKYMANVWQGSNTSDSEALDGYLLTSPVGVFGETKSGLTDMGGNVWQWCENNYMPYPQNGNIPSNNSNIKSTRGGSFMFDQALENSYTTTFRGQNSVETSLFNTGFRCAK